MESVKRGLALKDHGRVCALRRGLALKDHGRARTLKGLWGWRGCGGLARGSPAERPFKVHPLPWSFRARPRAPAHGQGYALLDKAST